MAVFAKAGIFRQVPLTLQSQCWPTPVTRVQPVYKNGVILAYLANSGIRNVCILQILRSPEWYEEWQELATTDRIRLDVGWPYWSPRAA